MKCLYEFHYSLLGRDFTAYILEVEKETEMTFRGKVTRADGMEYSGGFVVKKEMIDVVKATREYAYKVVVEADSLDDALQKTQSLMFEYLSQQIAFIKDAPIKEY